ncbi:hypothetical protein AB0E01_22850 [Nocardia vinacea]|uniref:hypothetical protein n=1 Tax=Nocardia vinacea TaxID=96468 RepID=UPI0033CF7895
MNTVRIVSTAAAVAVFGVAAGSAQAQPPVVPVHHVACFIQAVGPAKANSGSLGQISFGFNLHCDPNIPEKYHVTVVLHRYDFNRKEYYPHSTRDFTGVDLDFNSLTDHSPNDRNRTYFASCSDKNIQYEFHTEAILWGEHGNDRETDGNSDSVVLPC